jgi:hypothetical protein
MNEPAVSMTLSVTIRRPAQLVYDFLSDPHNMPRWAAGLGVSVRQQDDAWIVQTPAGPMKMVFAEKNRFGVADHTVYPPNAAPVYVPLRVLENGSGCDVVFTLFRQPDMSDAQYAQDAGLVRRDLQTLRELLEAS